jgi:hypothetical protein
MTILKSFVKKTHIGWVELRSNHLVEAMWLKDPAAETATLEAGIDAAESEASERTVASACAGGTLAALSLLKTLSDMTTFTAEQNQTMQLCSYRD